MIVNALLSHVTSPCGAKRLPMAPLRRRLGRLELYSQIIYNSSDPWITPLLASFPRKLRHAHLAAARPSTGSRLDDNFAFHVRVDQAQVVIFTRGCKSERELVVLDEDLRSEPFVLIGDIVGHGFIVDPGHGGAR